MTRHPDLVGAEAKLTRAREHIYSLEAEIRRFGSRHPEPLRLAIRPDSDAKLIPIVVAAVEHPDPTMSVIAGDALHNLRCALDHIAWQLVSHGTTPPSNLSPEAAERIKFPIVVVASKKGTAAADRFTNGLPEWLPGLASVHETIVRRHQPFLRSTEPETHPLALLQTLSNKDKHRDLRPVAFAPSTLDVRVESPPGCQVLGVNPGPEAGHPLRVGAEILYVTVADKARCDGLTVAPSAALTIAFHEERGPGKSPLGVFDALEWINSAIADLLDEVDRVL